MVGALRRELRDWWYSRATLVTGLVGRDATGEWSVDWVSDGRSPKGLRAATLSLVTTRAASAVVALAEESQRTAGVELQLAIFLGAKAGGAIFDAQGVAGSYVARDVQGSGVVVRGASLEALVEAIQALPGGVGQTATLRWVRPVKAIGADGVSTVVGPVPVAMPSVPDRFVRARRVFLFVFLVPVMLVAFLAMSVSDEAAAWSAHQGHGKPGTWTYIDSRCRRSLCVGWGSFVSDDGTDTRDRASMYETPQVMQPGASVRAVSIDDNQIFREGGGFIWFGKLLVAVSCMAFLGLWSWLVPVARFRRRRDSRSPRA